MLVEFRVGNYRSLKDEAILSLVAADLTAKDKSLDENNVIVVGDDLRLLTSAAIYGANASGKSNLLSAIRFMRGFVLNSSKESQAGDQIAIEPFRLDVASSEQPSKFEIVFIREGHRYRYGFEVTTERVVSEWLYHVPRVRETMLFKRDRQGIRPSGSFKEGRDLEDKTRPNALFLSVAAQFNGAIATGVLDWFRKMNVISGLEDEGVRPYTLARLSEPSFREDILDFVRQLDLGVEDVAVQTVRVTPDQIPRDLPEDLRKLLLGTAGIQQILVNTKHRTRDESGRASGIAWLDLDQHESEGTKKLFSFAGPFVDVLRNSEVLVIDELDARLHPLITRSIIGLFNCKRSNPRGAQLIFTTHDTNLLSNKIFRRDQVWFTEKDRSEASHLVSLAEYKVRNDASFELDYIRGKYGAIPYIGDFVAFMDGVDAAEQKEASEPARPQ